MARAIMLRRGEGDSLSSLCLRDLGERRDENADLGRAREGLRTMPAVYRLIALAGIVRH